MRRLRVAIEAPACLRGLYLGILFASWSRKTPPCSCTSTGPYRAYSVRDASVVSSSIRENLLLVHHSQENQRRMLYECRASTIFSPAISRGITSLSIRGITSGYALSAWMRLSTERNRAGDYSSSLIALHSDRLSLSLSLSLPLSLSLSLSLSLFVFPRNTSGTRLSAQFFSKCRIR